MYRIYKWVEYSWGRLRQHFLYRLNFKVQTDERKDQTLQILHQIIKAAQAFWVLWPVHVHQWACLWGSKGNVLVANNNFQFLLKWRNAMVNICMYIQIGGIYTKQSAYSPVDQPDLGAATADHLPALFLSQLWCALAPPWQIGGQMPLCGSWCRFYSWNCWRSVVFHLAGTRTPGTRVQTFPCVRHSNASRSPLLTFFHLRCPNSSRSF